MSGMIHPHGKVARPPIIDAKTKYSAMEPGLSVLFRLRTMMRASALKKAAPKPMM